MHINICHCSAFRPSVSDCTGISLCDESAFGHKWFELTLVRAEASPPLIAPAGSGFELVRAEGMCVVITYIEQ